MTQLTQTKKRTGASVNVYLILWRGDETLLLLRKNTGYADGMYAVVAGHVEDGESALQGLVREAREEAGIEIKPEDVQFVHVAHRHSNRYNVDLFFECRKWKGEPVNREPEKCGGLEFFHKDRLPQNLLVHVERAIKKKSLYSEEGW
jgi:8-oxo-dGTP diphosphatase